jgi:hypothetical protein
MAKALTRLACIAVSGSCCSEGEPATTITLHAPLTPRLDDEHHR